MPVQETLPHQLVLFSFHSLQSSIPALPFIEMLGASKLPPSYKGACPLLCSAHLVLACAM